MMDFSCEMIVMTNQGSTSGRRIDIAELVDRRLFKTLSLLLAKATNVRIPNTLLILDIDHDIIREVWQKWAQPLMIRVDFTKRPEQKVLGGIAVTNVERLVEICVWLLANGYFPLIHPFLDRFRNLYSAGVMISPSDRTLHVEAVGPGFDAGDLRLGTANPHETFNIVRHKAANPSVISTQTYLHDRQRRMEAIVRLQLYTDHVNGGGDLLANLDRFPAERPHIAKISQAVPEQYTPMPDVIRQELITASARIQANVVPSLPKSPTTVASFSYIDGHGWLLWDVYGHWYIR